MSYLGIKAMKPLVVLMNFTHVYEQERFVKNKAFEWIDCTDLHGTDCYCDKTAEKMLKKRIAPFPPEGIHFIDSGNYHYISKLWMDKIKYPFSLIIFDHHSDMQPALFDHLISCGSWVKDMLDTHPFLQKVCVAGASEKQVHEVGSAYSNRLLFYSETDLNHEEGWKRFSHMHLEESVYISVDKDILNHESAVTNWDQGSLSLQELERLLTIILKNEPVIGVDICGECSGLLNFFEFQQGELINSRTNEELIHLIQKYI